MRGRAGAAAEEPCGPRPIGGSRRGGNRRAEDVGRERAWHGGAMPRTPVDHVDPASSDEVPRSAAGAADGTDGMPEGADRPHGAVDGVDGTADGVDGAAGGRAGRTDAAQEEVPFGDQPVTRFAADVEYSGRAGEHDYLVLSLIHI